MLTAFCDRCKAEIGPAHQHVPHPGSKFDVPVFSERDHHLAGMFTADLCESCARDLVVHLTNWWGKLTDWQNEWNRPSKEPNA